MDRRAGIAFRGQMVVEKWFEDSDSESDPPDEIETMDQWIEGGQIVTDPYRIAELEAQLEQDDQS